MTFTSVTNNASSPFLDYDTNQLFFGDSAGRIHRVNNVDKSTAAKDRQLPGDVRHGAADRRRSTGTVRCSPRARTASSIGSTRRSRRPIPASRHSRAPRGYRRRRRRPLDADRRRDEQQVIVGTNNVGALRRARVRAYQPDVRAGADAPASYCCLERAPRRSRPSNPRSTTRSGRRTAAISYVAGTNTANSDTYLVQHPVQRRARQHHRLGRLASHQQRSPSSSDDPGHGIPDERREQPRLPLRRRQRHDGNYSFMNRISAGFSGSDASPSAMVARSRPRRDGHLVGHHHRHAHGRDDRLDGDRQHLLRHGGRQPATQSTIVQLAQGF